MQDATLAANPERKWFWRSCVLAVILLVSLFRIVYLARWCPLDLAPDEAHYWDWSRHLDWSYYSKGPLVAWLIRGSCELFGDWSRQLTGTEMLAVRVPAVLCGALLLLALYTLTVQAFGRERLAFAAVLLALSVPIISAGGLLMTIDAPFTCLWAWALVTGHCAIVQGRSWAWPVTGLLVGLGILAKYTMGLWLVSAGLCLLCTPELRRLLFGRGFWVMSAVAALCCVPIVWWNAANDWVTFRHVGTQAGLAGEARGAGINWLGPLEYLGGQFSLLLGYWLVAWVAAMVDFRPTRAAKPAVHYLWWMSVPTVALFGLVTFKAKAQLNWPVAGYLSGMVLVAAWLERQLTAPSQSYRRLAQVPLIAVCALGLVITAAIHNSRLAHPLVALVTRPPSVAEPFPLRKVDPTCRLRGWRHLAAELDTLRGEIAAAEGTEPVLAGIHWGLPGELGFYCAGHPAVYSVGPAFGDRHSQYDLWRPNPIADARAFRGRTMVIVGQGLLPRQPPAFHQAVAARQVVYREGDNPVAGWTIWVVRDFEGFDLSAVSGAGRDF
jgi:Dolichyl-phosphate-mannose-protein mannosyltransferase